MSSFEHQLSNVRLGSKSWCVVKTTVVDPSKVEKPEFLVHLSCGYVLSKGLQQNDDGTITAFVEIAGQRVKATHVFKTPAQAIAVAQRMMDEIHAGMPPTPEPN
jgi:hypothetical protein